MRRCRHGSAPPDSDNGAELKGVTVIGSTDAWAVGSAYGGDGRTTAITEHGDGDSWTLEPGASGHLFVGPELSGASSLGGDNVWAVGGGGYPGKIYTEHYDGTTWTRVATPDPFGRWTVLRGADAVAPDDAWAVGFAPCQAAPQGLRALGRHHVDCVDGTASRLVPPASASPLCGWLAPAG